MCVFFVHVKIYHLLGLNVVEVAHDVCILCEEWPMSSLLRLLRDKESTEKITKCHIKDKGITWFPELVDKRRLSIDHNLVYL